jgi:Gas vesicle protein K
MTRRKTTRSPRGRKPRTVTRDPATSSRSSRALPSDEPRPAKSIEIAAAEVAELDAMRAELERVAATTSPPRWNANPEDVQKSVVKLVLTLVEFIRQLLERQAIRRMEAGTLTEDQTEAVGLALMRLEETVRDLGAQFGLAPEDLTLDLGPVGRLI